ncbi:succinylglutamate desuccinylase/aspartoacylase family protein [Candidatus Nomurabacteria bacterium]|nr:succinylglutamate desuccinylase/aspartoacylase family protein [Candidatus Nomurabacteria bacterium]
MKHTKKTINIQNLPTGDQLRLHAYVFNGDIPGPHIYLQANLHGPEIFGVPLLGRVIQYLQNVKTFPGKITVVPCANPVGVQSVAYNALVGRWNPLTGKNWNRIFSVDQVFKTFEEQKHYYQKLLAQENISVEQRFAAELKILSYDAHYVIDIHTTGYKSINHLFTHKSARHCFQKLGPHVQILWEKQNAYGAFDESCVIPFLDTGEDVPKACTWEVSHHSVIEVSEMEDRFKRLVSWIESIWNKQQEKNEQVLTVPMESAQELFVSQGGYILWSAIPGQTVQTGKLYAQIYEPQTNTFTDLLAPFSFLLVSQYGIGAVSQGSPIAWIVRKEEK